MDTRLAIAIGLILYVVLTTAVSFLAIIITLLLVLRLQRRRALIKVG